MVNGKTKGNEQERKVCKLLSLWISDGTRDDLLWRSNSSGAQFTKRRKTVGGGFESQAGDIQSIDKLSERLMAVCAVEVKFYSDLQTKNVIYSESSLLMKFWNTHVRLGIEVGRVPILVAKENRKPEVILLPPIFEQLINLDNGVRVAQDCVIYPFSQILSLSYERFQSVLEDIWQQQFSKS